MLQYDHYINEKEKDGKFSVTEAVSLRCPQNYPGKIQLNYIFQNLRQEKETHILVSHL